MENVPMPAPHDIDDVVVGQVVERAGEVRKLLFKHFFFK